MSSSFVDQAKPADDALLTVLFAPIKEIFFGSFQESEKHMKKQCGNESLKRCFKGDAETRRDLLKRRLQLIDLRAGAEHS